ncbi:MAG: DUF2849 domain-containing protein [Kiloniellales bacterium]
MTLKVVTANRLRDGLVVFLAEGDGWSLSLTDARVADEPEEAEAIMAVAEQAAVDRIVVGPYLIDVTADNGTVRPVRYRERIRASGGPTIDPFETNHASEE